MSDDKRNEGREIIDGIVAGDIVVPMKSGYSKEVLDELKSNESQPKHMKLVNAMIEQGFVFVEDTPCIPHDGCFEFGWDAVQRAMVRFDPSCTNRTRKEAISTLEYIGHHVSAADPRYIEFKNGVLDVLTMEFMTTVEFLKMDVGIVPVVIPHEYKEDAEPCEAVETLLNGVSCNDKAVRMNLEEFVGLSMSRYADSRSSAPWGYGQGANGKSTLWEAVSFVVGEQNTCSLDLDDYKGQFNTQMLVGKLLAVSDDQIAHSVEKSVLGKIKKIVTGQPIKIEPKGVNPYNATMFCTIFVTSNEPPELSDTSDGSMRRWHFIPLIANFGKGAPGRDVNLRSKLKTEPAAQWLIKLGIEGLRRVLENEGMTETDYSRTAKQEAKERSNSVFEFLSEHPESEFLEYPNVEVWYWRYQASVKDKGGRPFEQSKFTMMVNAAYGFESKNNGRYKHGDPELSIGGLARDHGRGVNDRYRVFVKKQ